MSVTDGFVVVKFFVFIRAQDVLVEYWKEDNGRFVKESHFRKMLDVFSTAFCQMHVHFYKACIFN